MYTTIHFIPPDPGWTATEETLRRLIEYFNAEIISVSCYSEADYWDSDDPPHEVESLDRVSVDAGLGKLRAASPVCAMIVLENLKWSGVLARSLESKIPPDVAAGFLAWDVHFWLGVRTIRQPLDERTAARTCFDLTI